MIECQRCESHRAFKPFDEAELIEILAQAKYLHL